MAGWRRWRANRNFSKSLVIACLEPCGKRAKLWHTDSSAPSTLALSHSEEGKGEASGCLFHTCHPSTEAYHCTRPRLTSATRRFCARPSGGSFGAMDLIGYNMGMINLIALTHRGHNYAPRLRCCPSSHISTSLRFAESRGLRRDL